MCMISVKVLKEKYEECELITTIFNNTLSSLHNYVAAINKQEHFATSRELGKDNVINIIKKINAERCILCDDIICGIKAINRLCISEDLELFFDGDESNKSEVMHFALEFESRLISYNNIAI